MDKRPYTIGELARRSGLSARKIRFYADAGLLSPDRTEARYRVFDDRDLVILDLIRTLRDAGASLASIRSVLNRDASLGDLLAVRLADVEASIRRHKALATTLRLALKSDTPTINDLRRISQMIGHSQAQRHATATAFMNELTQGVRFDPGWREAMIHSIAAPDLPDEPSDEQIDAWLQVNAMLADPRLQRVLRAQAADTGRTMTFLRVRDDRDAWLARQNEILDRARSAIRRGATPASREGQALADAYIAFMAWNRGLADDEQFRASIREIWVDNEIIERFWRLVDVLKGHGNTTSAEYEWIAAATTLRLRNQG